MSMLVTLSVVALTLSLLTEIFFWIPNAATAAVVLSAG